MLRTLYICAIFKLLSYFLHGEMEDPRPLPQRGVFVALQGPLKHVHWLELLCLAQKFYKIKSFNCNNLRLTDRTHRFAKERLKSCNYKY